MIRGILCTAAFIVMPAFAGTASAQEDVDCDNTMTQTAMNICAGRDYEKADGALNAAYRAVLARAEALDGGLGEQGGAVDTLKKAQRAWITYRDRQCELAGFMARGGSIQPMVISGCLAELTQKRTGELEEALISQ